MMAARKEDEAWFPASLPTPLKERLWHWKTHPHQSTTGPDVGPLVHA